MPTEIHIPLLNANESEALLTGLYITNGQRVDRGDVLCTLETTKATEEFIADSSGFVAGLEMQVGQVVLSGSRLCFLSDNPDWQPETTPPAAEISGDEVNTPAGLRITQPALALARQHQLDLSQLGGEFLVTEAQVRQIIEQSFPQEVGQTDGVEFDPDAIIVYGGGGHGKSLIELIRAQNRYQIRGVVDDGIPAGSMILGVPVLGGSQILPGLYRNGVHQAVNAVGGIGNLALRIAIFQRLQAYGFICPVVVHPTAFIEASATISDGVQVFPFSYIGSESKIGYGTIINTGAIVSHDCTIGEYSNLSPGAILAGEVQISSNVLIGMGVTVNLRVKIGSGARIGNGATIKSDVPDKGFVHAGTIWPIA